ncbi:MAG: type II secretion system minor pseudopilin GspH [Pseudomonadales bacterium]|nr:type II secretion system minor pseudopilin GspH [Pseudomonadales bacterium]
MLAARSSHGFTLIEILVVVVIVAIMTGVVVANLPSFSHTADLDREARRLSALFGMLRAEAVSQANEYGFEPDRDKYRFFILNEREGKWQEITEGPFAARTLEDGIVLTAKVESEDLVLDVPDEDDDVKPPPILVLSSGEVTPFQVTLALDASDAQRTLTTDGFSDLAKVTDENER